MSPAPLSNTSFRKAPNRARTLNTVLGLVAVSLVATLGLGGPNFTQKALLDGVCSHGESTLQAPAAVPAPVPVSVASPLACGEADAIASQ
jgi:hypothetical protein